MIKLYIINKEGGDNSIKKYRNKRYLNKHSSPNFFFKKMAVKNRFHGNVAAKGSEVQVTKI